MNKKRCLPVGLQIRLHGGLDRGQIAAVRKACCNDRLDGGDGVRTRLEDGIGGLDGLGLEGGDGRHGGLLVCWYR